jgi:hypothetical protein
LTEKLIFRILIAIGCLLWIISNIGESSGYQPLSTIGMLISLPITGLGIYYWFNYYKSSRGYYPKFMKTYRYLIKGMKKNPFFGIIFMVKNLLKFYVCLVLFSMGIVFLGYATIAQSESVKTTQRYCINSSEIKLITGEIRYFGILRNVQNTYNSTGGKSKMSLTIVGKKGNFKVNSELEKINDEWRVIVLTLTDINTGANKVYKK